MMRGAVKKRHIGCRLTCRGSRRLSNLVHVRQWLFLGRMWRHRRRTSGRRQMFGVLRAVLERLLISLVGRVGYGRLSVVGDAEGVLMGRYFGRRIEYGYRG